MEWEDELGIKRKEDMREGMCGETVQVKGHLKGAMKT